MTIHTKSLFFIPGDQHDIRDTRQGGVKLSLIRGRGRQWERETGTARRQGR